jgi:3-oxoacyl-[acyl-carrier protein] reductase
MRATGSRWFGVSEAEWRAVVDGNLTSTFLTLEAFLPGMIERRRGSIITIASTAARIPTPAPASYAAAKAAIVMLTRQSRLTGITLDVAGGKMML